MNVNTWLRGWGSYNRRNYIELIQGQKIHFSGRGGEEKRSGTKKPCNNLQSGHPAWWSADNCSIFPTVNIFRLFRSNKRTGRGNQKCLKNWKNNVLHLCFSCISYLSFGTEIAEETKTQPCLILTNNNALDRDLVIGCIVFAGQG